MSHYSIIIKNGLVFDGKGNKPIKADIGLEENEGKKKNDVLAETHPHTFLS